MKTWKQNAFWSIMAIMVLTFTIIACDDGNGNGTTEKFDPALNGTWEAPVGATYVGTYKFNNGILEEPDWPAKGSYTTNEGILTMTRTHVKGTFIKNNNSEINGYPVSKLPEFDESKWYSKVDLNSAGIVEFDSFLSTRSRPYKVEGNTLTWTFESNGETRTQVWTRIN